MDHFSTSYDNILLIIFVVIYLVLPVKIFLAAVTVLVHYTPSL